MFARILSQQKICLFLVKHIRKVDGFFGMYRGLTPKLIGIVIGSVGSDKIAQKLGFEEEIVEPKDGILSSEEE